MNQYTGSNFDDFLAEEGILEEVTARAHKRLLALQLQDATLAPAGSAGVDEVQISKSELAGRLQTSRSQVDRLLDPDNTAVTLDSLERLVRGWQAIGRSPGLAPKPNAIRCAPCVHSWRWLGSNHD